MKLVNETFSCYPTENGTDMLMTKAAKMNYLVVAIVFAWIDVISIILNVIFVCIFSQNKKLWAARTHILLLLLVVSDLTCCIVVMSPAIFFMVMRSNGYALCELATFLRFIGFSNIFMSMSIVFVINLDLYLAVVKPYLYESKKIKVQTIVILVTICWSIIFLVSAICMYVAPIWKEYGVLMCCVTIILFIYLSYFHYKINKELARMTARESKVNSAAIMMIKTHNKTFKLATAILVVFILVFLPSIVMIIYRIVRLPSAFVNSYVFQWFQPFSLTNVFWNPILYYYRMKSIRKSFVQGLLRKWCSRERETVNRVTKFDSVVVSYHPELQVCNFKRDETIVATQGELSTE